MFRLTLIKEQSDAIFLIIKKLKALSNQEILGKRAL